MYHTHFILICKPYFSHFLNAEECLLVFPDDEDEPSTRKKALAISRKDFSLYNHLFRKALTFHQSTIVEHLRRISSLAPVIRMAAISEG